VAFGPGPELVVSERFHDAWLERSLGGVAFDRVEVSDVQTKLAHAPRGDLYVAFPASGSVRSERSRTVLLGEADDAVPCEVCGSGRSVDAVLGLAIDERTWGGEDLFYLLDLPGVLIASQRVMDLAAQHRLCNVNLTPVAKYVWDPLGLASHRS
jgi:hypothetical protein